MTALIFSSFNGLPGMAQTTMQVIASNRPLLQFGWYADDYIPGQQRLFQYQYQRRGKGIYFYRISDATHPLIDAGKILVL